MAETTATRATKSTGRNMMATGEARRDQTGLNGTGQHQAVLDCSITSGLFIYQSEGCEGVDCHTVRQGYPALTPAQRADHVEGG